MSRRLDLFGYMVLVLVHHIVNSALPSLKVLRTASVQDSAVLSSRRIDKDRAIYLYPFVFHETNDNIFHFIVALIGAIGQ